MLKSEKTRELSSSAFTGIGRACQRKVRLLDVEDKTKRRTSEEESCKRHTAPSGGQDSPEAPKKSKEGVSLARDPTSEEATYWRNQYLESRYMILKGLNITTRTNTTHARGQVVGLTLSDPI
jgi:hypothetical protein